MPVPVADAIELADDERAALEGFVRRRTSARGLAQRSEIVLEAAAGRTNTEIAARLRVSRPTVTRWRRRFAERRVDGLVDQPRPGRTRPISDEQVERVVVKTLETTPRDATHWSTRSMAAQVGLTQNAILRIWHAYGLQPRRTDTLQGPAVRRQRSTPSSPCISTRPSARSCCASTRSARPRRWTAPSRSCRCYSTTA